MNNRKAPLCLQNSPYSLNEKWFIQPVFSVLTLLVQRQSFSKHFFTSFYLKVVVILSTPVFRGTHFSRFHKKIAHWKSVNKDFPQISRKWNFVPWLLITYMSFYVKITWCLWWAFELIHVPEAFVTSGEIWLILLETNLCTARCFHKDV